MTLALCDASGLLKNLLDNLSGKNSAEWLEILRRTLRRQNPFHAQSSVYAIRLTPSLIAGTKALAELRSQGRIPTSNWHDLEVEPLDNHNGYSDAYRTMIFMLENGQRVEVNVTTWKRDTMGVAEDNEKYKWSPTYVRVEKGPRMEFFENHVNLEGYPWTRHPPFDKPLPGFTWRNPTPTEAAAYKAAIEKHDEGAFLKVYYAGLIEWKDFNDDLGRDTGWVWQTLQKVA